MGIAILASMVREDWEEEVTFHLRPEGTEVATYRDQSSV